MNKRHGKRIEREEIDEDQEFGEETTLFWVKPGEILDKVLPDLVIMSIRTAGPKIVKRSEGSGRTADRLASWLAGKRTDQGLVGVYSTELFQPAWNRPTGRQTDTDTAKRGQNAAASAASEAAMKASSLGFSTQIALMKRLRDLRKTNLVFGSLTQETDPDRNTSERHQ